MTALLEQHRSHDLCVVGGLAGFPDSERYALQEVAGGGPLLRLTSLDEPGLEFLVVPPGAFFPEYAPVLDDVSAERLGLVTSEDAMLLVVVTVGPTAKDATANLLAPLVLNARTRQAVQVILSGTDWPVRAAVA